MDFAGEFLGAGGYSRRGRSEDLGGPREAGMAEAEGPSGEFRATKGLRVEGRGLEHDGNRGSLLTETQRGEGRVESLSFSNGSSICNPFTDSFLFRQALGSAEWYW